MAYLHYCESYFQDKAVIAYVGYQLTHTDKAYLTVFYA
jgi:hypothetical protein